MEPTEQAYKDQIKDLEQQIRLLKEQVDFLTRRLYGTRSEKTSLLQIEGQMSLFNEIEANADPDAHEPELVEVEKHLRKKKYAGQKEVIILVYLVQASCNIRTTVPALCGHWFSQHPDKIPVPSRQDDIIGYYILFPVLCHPRRQPPYVPRWDGVKDL